jgi:hypothetical protein
MLHDRLTDDLNWSARYEFKGGGMPTQVMETQMDSKQLAGFLNHNAGWVSANSK